MKIGLVCPYDRAYYGGVQSHVAGLARALNRRGHETVVLAPSDKPRAPGDPPCLGRSWPFLFHGTQTHLSLASPRSLPELWRGLDLLHFHTPWAPLASAQLWVSAPLPRVVTFHDVPHRGGLLGLQKLLVHSMARRARTMIAVSPMVQDYLTGVPPERLRLIPNGISPELLERPLAGHPEVPDLLYLGRLEPRKGVSFLLEAVARLSQDFPTLGLTVAGEGPLRPALEAQARSLGLGRRVQFLGAVSEDQKWNLLDRCGLVCAPAFRGESFGIVLLEAMVAGRPVLAAANPGYQGLLGSSPFPQLVEPGSSRALEEGLRPFLLDRALRAEAGRWGRQESRRYDWTVLAAQVEEAYLSS